jgi:hypothetical protein
MEVVTTVNGGGTDDGDTVWTANGPICGFLFTPNY